MPTPVKPDVTPDPLDVRLARPRTESARNAPARTPTTCPERRRSAPPTRAPRHFDVRPRSGYDSLLVPSPPEASMLRTRRLAVAALLLTPIVLPAQARPAAAPAAQISPDVYSRLSWRTIGPEGNRFSAAAGIPGDHTDLLRRRRVGRHLEDHRRRHELDADLRRPAGAVDRLARGRAIAIRTSSGPAPARGRSAATSRSARASTSRMDAGKTWTLMGLEKTGRIPRTVIHPQDPDIVLVCALGHAYGPQPERGVFRTTDGGATWTEVALRRREHRLLRHRDGPEEPAHPVRRACGSSRSRPGDARAAARAAASSCRATAARRGRG